jgi:hypothetical protein
MEFLNQNMHNIIVAGVILLILIVLAIAWRKFSPRVSGGRRGQRLGVSEYYEVDKDRRLVIVRRDSVEHLILIGGPQDMVIESGIGASAASQGAGMATAGEISSATPPLGTARPAPRASVFVEKKAPPLRQASDQGPIIGRSEPEL